MPPRAGQRRGTMSLLQLPPDLLIRIFGQLEFAERHRALPLVSQRCRSLLCSPQLLHTVSLSVPANCGQPMRYVRSMARFVMRCAAGSVQHLSLNLRSTGEADPQQRQECMALLAAAGGACHGLIELDIAWYPSITLGSWLLPLAGSLRSLCTGRWTDAHVAEPLSLLTALQDLEMGRRSGTVVLADDAALPTSLTRLAIRVTYIYQSVAPAQIGRLRLLQHLQLVSPWEEAESYAELAQLPSLETLKLTGGVGEAPRCLSAFKRLRALTVHCCIGYVEYDEEEAPARALAPALPHLTQLTYLALHVWKGAPLLACLTALTSLRHLYWWCPGERRETQLPPGSWAAGLRLLAAPDDLIAGNLAVLSSAQHLEQLSLYSCYGDPPKAALGAILNWAAHHPSLQQLLIGDHALSAVLWAKIASLSRMRPSLSIEPSSLFCPDFVRSAIQPEKPALSF